MSTRTIQATLTRLKTPVLALLLTAGLASPALDAVAPAAATARTWSVAASFRQANGFEYDYIFARGVATEDLGDVLGECGASHRVGFVVWYHCYPIPE